MLLIACPYCGESRGEEEFSYGGEAHIARHRTPTPLPMKPGAITCFSARTLAGSITRYGSMPPDAGGIST